MKRHRKRTIKETSKTIVFTILWMAIIDIQLSYLLAFLGKEPLENVTDTLIVSVIVFLLGYFVKAFFGKKNEEQIKYDRDANNVPEREEEI